MNRVRIVATSLWLCAVAVMVPRVVCGAPIAIDPFDGTLHNGWAKASGNGTVSKANDDTFAFTGGSQLQQLLSGVFQTSGGNVAAYNGGNWAGSTALSLRFDFDATAGGPAGFTIFFTAAGGLGTWSYTQPIAGGIVKTYVVNLDYTFEDGWYRVDAGPDTALAFSAALASVATVGFELDYRPFEDNQTYVIDNVSLHDEPKVLTTVFSFR